jgi:hypothetical protein
VLPVAQGCRRGRDVGQPLGTGSSFIRARELLDRVLIINERQASDVLRVFEQHYNEHRPHRSLDQAAPLQPLCTRTRTSGASGDATASAVCFTSISRSHNVHPVSGTHKGSPSDGTGGTRGPVGARQNPERPPLPRPGPATLLANPTARRRPAHRSYDQLPPRRLLPDRHRDREMHTVCAVWDAKIRLRTLSYRFPAAVGLGRSTMRRSIGHVRGVRQGLQPGLSTIRTLLPGPKPKDHPSAELSRSAP